MNISDTIDFHLLEEFYIEYDGYCMNLYEGGFYVEWLTRDEFMQAIKTYADLVKIHISIGYIKNESEASYLY